MADLTEKVAADQAAEKRKRIIKIAVTGVLIAVVVYVVYKFVLKR